MLSETTAPPPTVPTGPAPTAEQGSAPAVGVRARRGRLAGLPRPFIVAVVTDRDPAAALATMRLARLEGAHAAELNLPLLADADPAAFRAALRGAGLVPYVTCRRRAFMAVYGVDPATLPAWSDDERMARQLAAIDLGAQAIDIEMDTFDPRPSPPLGTPAALAFATTPGDPAEWSHDPVAISRQREVVARAHQAGADVIVSCHTGRPCGADTLVAIAADAVARGADLVKIVSPCPARSDLYDLLEANTRCAQTLPVPVAIVGAGPAGDLSRLLGTHFGAGWAIAQLTLTPGGFHPQPLIAQVRETLRLVPWRAEVDAPCA